MGSQGWLPLYQQYPSTSFNNNRTNKQGAVEKDDEDRRPSKRSEVDERRQSMVGGEERGDFVCVYVSMRVMCECV